MRLPFAAAAPSRSDTTAFEVSSLRAAFGPWLPLVRRAMKLGKIESREDIDRIASALLKSGL